MNDQEFARRMLQQTEEHCRELQAIYDRHARHDAIALVVFLIVFTALVIAAPFIVMAAR